VFEGTVMVRRLLLLLAVKTTEDGFRVAIGPLGLVIAESSRVPWKLLRPWKLKVRLELLPACIVRMLAGVLIVKSVTVIVN